MSNRSTDVDQLKAEISRLRRKVAELEGVEMRCQRAEAALEAVEERNRLLGDSTPLGMFTIDHQGTITGINRKMAAMFARLSVSDPQAINLFAAPALAASGMVADIRRCMARREAVIDEHPYTDPGNTCHHWRHYLSPIPGADGSVVGVMAVVEDCTELKAAEEALRESEQRYRQLFQSAPIALIEWDVSRLKAYLDELRTSGVSDLAAYLEAETQQIHHCWSLIRTVGYNHAFLELMGVADSGGPAGAFIPTDTEFFLKMAREVILLAADGTRVDEREETLVTTSGEAKVVLGKSLVVPGHEDTLGRVAIALLDISQRKKAEAALRDSERRFREQALRDGLTGLYNQRYLYQRLAECIDTAEQHDTPVSLIFIDLDRFKEVVDTHGHLNGSRAIRDVARTIDSCLEAPAFAVAYAGDEFVVVLPGWDQPRAADKASQIRERIKQTRYVLNQGIEVRLQASFGVATYPQDAASLNDLIAAADHALFAVKEAGKDAVKHFRK
jgi:diguanylate cyclase (GGDEF)-like protein/PAS domain S-box-containing protein